MAASLQIVWDRSRPPRPWQLKVNGFVFNAKSELECLQQAEKSLEKALGDVKQRIADQCKGEPSDGR